MTRCRWLTAVGILGLLVASLSDQAAAGQKSVKKDEAHYAGLISKDVITAVELAELGRQNRAPEALLAAAGLLLKAHAYTGGSLPQLGETVKNKKGKVISVPIEVTDEKGNKLDVPVETPPSFKKQAEDMLDEARGLATKLTGFEALIKAVKNRDYTQTEEYKNYLAAKKVKTRSVAGEPKQITRKIPAGAAHVYTIRYDANELGAVAVQSDAPVRLVVVSPGDGKVMDSVVTTTRYTWTPKGNSVKIEIHAVDKLAKYTVFAH